MKIIPSLVSITIVTVSWAAVGCSRASVLTINNQAPLTLSNVVVSGAGFSERIGSISAGGEHRVSIRPEGKSTVRLVFDAGSRHLDSGPQGYFDSGEVDQIFVNVRANLSVSASWE